MSSFNNNGVTLKGAVIIASLVAGDTLTFTRIAVGDGVLPSGQTVLTTEKLVNPLFDVPVSSVESDSVAHATVKGIFSNADLDTGFYYRELGLFAINPVTKAEELFCYGNAGDEAEWINAVGESSLVEKEIHLVTLIGNATTVTANFDPKAPALKSEMDAILPLKADLDATPENGGRVLAKQMRFDKTQTLYVNASAAAGGDGTESKPFKTIQEAVDARYRGASNAIINIAPGEYNEVISISNIAGLAWTFQRNGTGVAKVKSLAFGNCSHISITDLTIEPESSFGISLNNVASAYLTGIAINGTTASNGFSISLSRAVIFQTTINNTNIAVATGNNSQVTMVSVAGTGNNLVVSADASVITMANNTIVGTNKYDKLNGGVINVEGGGSSFPSNYSQLYYLGSVATAESLKTILLTEFVKLKERESRTCSFANNIPEGLGPFQGGQNMYVDIVKNSSQGNGFGVVFVRAHFEPAAGYWIIQNGAFITDVPKVFAVVEPATPASYGLMRVAAPVVDELDSTCSDAALTPANVHAMANYRIANHTYAVGDIVAVPYHAEFMLKCTQAGTTSTGSLDTTSATLGKVYTDDGVKWEVIVLPVELGGTGGTTKNQARANLQTNIKTFLTFESLGLNPATATIKALSDALVAQGGYAVFKEYITSEYMPNFEVPLDGFFTCYCLTGSMTMEVYNHAGNRMWVSAYVRNSNVIQSWKEVANKGNLSMPSGEKISISVPSGNADMGYNAPADGYITVVATGSASNGGSYISFINYGGAISGIFNAPTNSTRIRAFMPVAKGQGVQIHSGNISSIDEAYFVYAQSEV